MAMPATAAAEPAPMATPKKRRYVSSRKRFACTPLDDPWDNLCTIQKKAEVACADLSNGKARAMRGKRAKEAPPPVVGNPRQECINAYMNNV
jgi:hypothetical protein